MKTVTNILTCEVRRVTDAQAVELCGGIIPVCTALPWRYAPKSKWKALHAVKPTTKP